MLENFFTLTPERVLTAVERAGQRTTGLCYALNSLENRVYEVELEDRTRLVGKFYRPSRWSQEAIEDEHRLLLALEADEIPVCPPVTIDGQTLHRTEDGIFYALFPKVGGRSPDELDLEGFEQLGRLLARIHNVAASLSITHRPAISPATYGSESLQTILKRTDMSLGVRQRYIDAVEALVVQADLRLADLETLPLHGDCHRGNLLLGSEGWFFLDFDDMGIGPAVQDLWLLLPARADGCPQELDAMLQGYEQFRDFPRHSLRGIEALRGLRYVRYAAWVARRWDDPAFQRAFPDWGTDRYWEGQVADLSEQLLHLSKEDTTGLH